MNEVFKPYRKLGVQMMRPYIIGEDMTGISVANTDTPEEGGMVAIDPSNPGDKWYVSKEFFIKSYEAA